MSERRLYACGCASQGDQEWLCKTHEAKQARDEALLARNKPDPSVPLSAIRALVQQWEDAKSRASQKATDARKDRRDSDELLWSVIASTTAQCLSELAALCPALHEDGK